VGVPLVHVGHQRDPHLTIELYAVDWSSPTYTIATGPIGESQAVERLESQLAKGDSVGMYFHHNETCDVLSKSSEIGWTAGVVPNRGRQENHQVFQVEASTQIMSGRLAKGGQSSMGVRVRA
jgi:hypothetical protein